MKLNQGFFIQAYLVLSLAFATCISQAQQTATTIVIEVVDEKGVIINDVYLVVEPSNVFLGATSNGRAEFIATQNELSIRFSHLSYVNTIVKLEGLLNKDTVQKKVILQSKLFGIEEVSISSELSSVAYKNEAINVMDYEFYNNSILMLCGLGKNKQLRLASEDGYDITSMYLPKGAKEIFKDCLNNIHLLYKDSVYLVKFTDTSLFIVNPYSRYEFDKTAGICEAAIGKNIIIGRVGVHQQEVNYFIKPDTTTQYSLLKKIINYKDQAIEKSFARAYDMEKGSGANSGSAETHQQLLTARKLDRAYTYYKYILSHPLYSPIFEIEEQFVLFDIQNNIVEWYSPSGVIVDSLLLNFKKVEDWSNLLLFDKTSEDVYLFKTNGPKKYVQSLDLNTGSLGSSIRIEKHPFAENYQVKEGYVYYLYRENYQPGLPKKLYKHRL